MMFAVLKAWHPMIGRDFHIPWPPGSPSPLPSPAPYTTFSVMYGTGVTCRYTKTMFTSEWAPAMVRGTDIGPLIPHIGPPSITILLEILLSGSKSHFGPIGTQVSDQYGAAGNPAAALGIVINPNLNCGFPLPTPTGIVIAPTTHFVGMTLGDLVAGLLSMAFDFLIQALLNKLGAAAGNWLGKGAGAIANKFGIGVLSRAAARRAAREAWKAAGKAGPLSAFARPLERAGLERIVRILTVYGPAKIGFWFGAPLGPSASNLRDGQGEQHVPAIYDRVLGKLGGFDPEMKNVGQAVDDFFRTPEVEHVGPPAPPAASPSPAPPAAPAAPPSPAPSPDPTPSPGSAVPSGSKTPGPGGGR
jgi:hypothetical protein